MFLFNCSNQVLIIIITITYYPEATAITTSTTTLSFILFHLPRHHRLQTLAVVAVGLEVRARSGQVPWLIEPVWLTSPCLSRHSNARAATPPTLSSATSTTTASRSLAISAKPADATGHVVARWETFRSEEAAGETKGAAKEEVAGLNLRLAALTAPPVRQAHLVKQFHPIVQLELSIWWQLG